jgi:hypothetical protein
MAAKWHCDPGFEYMTDGEIVSATAEQRDEEKNMESSKKTVILLVISYVMHLLLLIDMSNCTLNSYGHK